MQIQSQKQSVAVDRPARQTQSGTSGNRGHVRAQGDRTQGTVFTMTQEEARVTPNVVAGTLLLNHLPIYVLFDPGATHSFVAHKAVGKLGRSPSRVGKGFIISTPLRKHVDIDIIYMGIKLEIMGCETHVDLIPLGIHDFDIILGMDWLGKYRAQMDCFAKTVTFSGSMGERVVF